MNCDHSSSQFNTMSGFFEEAALFCSKFQDELSFLDIEVSKLNAEEMLTEESIIIKHLQNASMLVNQLRKGCPKSPDFQNGIVDSKFHLKLVNFLEIFVNISCRLGNDLEWISHKFMWECIGCVSNSVIGNDGARYLVWTEMTPYEIIRMFIISSPVLSDVQMMFMQNFSSCEKVLNELFSKDNPLLLFILTSLSAAQASIDGTVYKNNNPSLGLNTKEDEKSKWTPSQHGFATIFLSTLANKCVPVRIAQTDPIQKITEVLDDTQNRLQSLIHLDQSCAIHLLATVMNYPLHEIILNFTRILEPQNHRGKSTAITEFNRQTLRGNWLYERVLAASPGRRVILGFLFDTFSEMAHNEMIANGEASCSPLQNRNSQNCDLCIRCQLAKASLLVIEIAERKICADASGVPGIIDEISSQWSSAETPAELLAKTSASSSPLIGTCGIWEFNTNDYLIKWVPDIDDAVSCFKFAVRAAANVLATDRVPGKPECSEFLQLHLKLAFHTLRIFNVAQRVRSRAVVDSIKAQERLGSETVDNVIKDLNLNEFDENNKKVNWNSRWQELLMIISPSDLARLLGNLMFRSSRVATAVGAWGGMKILLAACKGDADDPLLKESCIVALRAATRWQNGFNQTIIYNLLQDEKDLIIRLNASEATKQKSLEPDDGC